MKNICALCTARPGKRSPLDISPPLRSADHPEGLPEIGCNPQHPLHDKVELGNTIAKHSVILQLIIMFVGGAADLENHWDSKLMAIYGSKHGKQV